MTNHLQRLITAGVIVIALQSQAAMAQTGFPDVKAPRIPPELQVPPGNTAYLKGSAVGTQNYICQSSESGFTWKFLGPQATLFYTFQWYNSQVSQQITTHFLSPNPLEGGTPRATWQSSLDTSSVWARAIASSTDPNFVAPGAIPWLLLQVVGSQEGPTGGKMLANTTFIHRVNTAGGVAPATGCDQSTNVGVVAFVPYATDYFFYKATR
jgi:hypothetical protein